MLNHGDVNDVGNLCKYTARTLRLAARIVCGLDDNRAHHMEQEQLARHIVDSGMVPLAVEWMEEELASCRGEGAVA